MKRTLQFLLIIFFLMLISVNAGQDKKINEKENMSKLLKRAAKMICTLDINEQAAPSFSKLKKKIVRHLKRAVSASNSKIQKIYFEDIIKIFKTNKYSELPDLYFSKEARADLLLKYEKKSQMITAVVLKLSGEENSSMQKLFDKIRIEIGKGILERNVRFFPKDNVIKISDVIYPDNFKKESLIFNSPSKNDLYPGIILLKNVIEKYFNEKIKPLSEKILRRKISAGLNSGSIIRNLFLHHIAHFTIPFQTEMKDEKSIYKGSDLKNLLLPAEEIRADLNYLMIIVRLAEKDILEEEVKEEVIFTFLLQKIDRIITLKENNNNSPSMVLFNALYKRGGIKIEKGGKKIVVDMELLIRNIKNLESRFNDILKKGIHGECKIFFQKHMEIPEKLKSIIGKKKPVNIE